MNFNFPRIFSISFFLFSPLLIMWQNGKNLMWRLYLVARALAPFEAVCLGNSSRTLFDQNFQNFYLYYEITAGIFFALKFMQAQDLLSSIAVLEDAVVRLEQEMVSLHFQLSQEKNERRLAEYRLMHSSPCSISLRSNSDSMKKMVSHHIDFCLDVNICFFFSWNFSWVLTCI